MILFTILAIILVLIVLLAVFLISVGGVAFIAIFADLIVCAGIIALIMRAIFKRRH